MSQTNMNSQNEETKYKLSLILLVALALVAIFAVISMTGKLMNREEPIITEPTTTAPTTEPPINRENKTVSNTTGGTLIVVNNANLYQPSDTLSVLKNTEYFDRAFNDMLLREEAINALTEVFKKYRDDFSEKSEFYLPHIKIAFRSIEDQESKYNEADDKTTVSLPGGSDLHTGYSFRFMLVNEKNGSFHQIDSITEVQAWVNENFPKFGFIDRYPENGNTDFKGTSIVGYGFYRYVGLPHSLYISENGISLEDYIDYLKANYSIDENPEFELSDLLKVEYENQNYYILYKSAENNKATISLPPNTEIHSFSGDNMDGFIIVLVNLEEAEDLPDVEGDASVANVE